MDDTSWVTGIPEEQDTEKNIHEQVKGLKNKKKNKKKKNLLVIILIIVITGGVLFVYQNIHGHMPWSSATVAINKSATTEYKVMETYYSTTVDLSGRLEANNIQSVNFRISGACTEVCVTEGDTVVEGQLIARIDDISYQKEIKEIEASIARAEITGSVSDLEILQLELKEATNNLEYTKVFASFDGVVSDSELEVGDYVEKGDTYMTIIDVNSLKATVEIDEIDMQYIELGQKAELSLDAYPEGKLEATVAYIPMVGRTTSSGIGVLDVELTIENPPEALKIGYTFEGEINIEGENVILLIPQIAISQDRKTGTTLKKLNDDGSISTITVTTKYLGEGYSQIISGNVKAGDTVVTVSTDNSKSTVSSGLEMIMPGMSGGNQQPAGGPPAGERRNN